VILSNYYDLPFNDILDWRKFAVVLKESDVYQLKQILKKISQDEFVTLHNNLVKVIFSLLYLMEWFIFHPLLIVQEMYHCYITCLNFTLEFLIISYIV
jgi:hypothetical protein